MAAKNSFIMSTFWLVAGIPGAENFIPLGWEEKVDFDIHWMMALPVIVLNIAFGILICSLIYPVYQEFAWSMFESIGSDLDQRQLFRMHQITRGSYLMVSVFTILQLGYLLYFEIELWQHLVFVFLSIITIAMFVLGYHAVF